MKTEFIQDATGIPMQATVICSRLQCASFQRLFTMMQYTAVFQY